MEIKENIILESGLSRIWQHTKDGGTFAIIGSDEKTKDGKHIDRSEDLIHMIYDNRKTKNRVSGYNYIRGSYTYDDGVITYENSIIVYNISKEDALRIASDLGQEAITWKDPDFFGIIKVPNGEVDIEFANGVKNMNFSDDAIKAVGGSSLLVGKKWKERGVNSEKPFVFEAYLLQPDKKNYGTRNLYPLCKERVLENGDIAPSYFEDKETLTVKEALKQLKNKW